MPAGAICGLWMLDSVYLHSSPDTNIKLFYYIFYVALGGLMGLDMNINIFYYLSYAARAVSMGLDMNINTFYYVSYVARGGSIDLDISKIELCTAIEVDRAK